MKTTIELPDALFRQAKTFAATRGTTIRQLLSEALESHRRRVARSNPAGVAEPPWMAGFGALSDLTEENRRVLFAIEEEFEKPS